MENDRFLSIGKIVGVHGIHGTLKVYSYAESLSFYDAGNAILIRTPSGDKRTCMIKSGKPHKKTILLILAEITDRNAAEDLVGSELLAERSALPALKDGEYYWIDIIGCDVFTEGEDYIGRVESIFPTGNNDVYVVKNPETGKETLIPALKTVVGDIDLDEKKIVVNLPEGL